MSRKEPDLMSALLELEKERGIQRNTLVEAIEAALVSAFKKHYHSDEVRVQAKVDPETGQVSVSMFKEVAAEVSDPRTQIGIEDARGLDPAYRVGDVVEIPVAPREFGRIAAQTAKQVVMQRLRETERGMVYEEFASREGDIVTGIVERVQGRHVFLNLGKLEAALLPTEQIPGEDYLVGQRVKVYIVEVRRTTKGPQVLVSRTHPALLKRLLELEVPEVHEGVVEIKALAREAGSRSKVAVMSRDPNVDPVGACVGQKGMRISVVSEELHGEKIDVIEWSADVAEFVANALSPSRVSQVRIQEAEKLARVIVPDYQLSLAIGKAGQNARLAAKLTGWRIDIWSESQLEERGESLGDLPPRVFVPTPLPQQPVSPFAPSKSSEPEFSPFAKRPGSDDTRG